ncbi:outer membrane autotransporter protein [Sphingopyxis panaciterrae]|uniref:autotransporter outer membrane beta-barrel domain-containing protein n=1 Tax=Sphingopyxis panaciterrae TaxID=363841 RepID=UPI00141F13CD|nr:autotransporter outer membrane beta-barrel domain-containing protein [Sphingopyxis panaciterrae]NIJ37538.1 outer membrane autotransporter protein [Sphingopyxis panaciterrae]
MPVPPTPKRHPSKRPLGLLCSTALAGVAVLALSACPVQAQSLPYAKGGAGAAGTSAGGNGGDPGQAGQDGEGAGAGTGGTAGASPGADGGNGNLGTDASGGGGGGGGAHGGVLTGDPTGDMKGGDGGSGGSVVFGGRSGGGGGGGAGGDGAIFDGDLAATISIQADIALSGGNGGAGGGPVLGDGGGGGAGLSFSGGTVKNAGSISGGMGGRSSNPAAGIGGNGLNFSGRAVENIGAIRGGVGGGDGFQYSGSDGGIGLFFTGEMVTNGGAISGGDGGAARGASGAGGGGLSFTGETMTNSGTISGGDGGLVTQGDYGDVVGGGGGVGLAFSGAAVMNEGGISGGDGGAIRGNASGLTIIGGLGGEGVAMGVGTLTNSATITGGNGGSQLDDDGAPGRYPFNDGGDGGIGVRGTGSTVLNSGSIAGGVGGVGGNDGSDGAGAAGIAGSDLTIVNSGTIAGGLSGDGSGRASAIVFTGGTNRLELQTGSAIIGRVDATAAGSNDWLVLGGAADGSFDVGRIGTFEDYRGFEHFEKTGAGTWTLTGMGAQDWSIGAGSLRGDTRSIGGDLAFGAGTGVRGVIFDQSVDGSYGGAMSGNGRLIKTGAGMLTLTGDNAVAMFDVRDGMLRIDGAALVQPNYSTANNRIGSGAGESAAMEIVRGGSVTAASQWDIGYDTGSSGSATVAGNGSSLTSSFQMTVGNAGEGSLAVADGGLASIAVLYLGGGNGGTLGQGTMAVSGAGSRAEIGTLGLAVHGNGSVGAITLSDGGVLDVQYGITMGQANATGAARINIGGATTDSADAAAAGTLHTPRLMFYEDSASLNFNHTDGAYVFDTLLESRSSGAGFVHHYAGNTTLTADNSGFSGDTIVDGGRLLVNNVLGGTVSVNSGGTLGGSGTVGTTSVGDGGRIAPGNSVGKLTIDGNLTLSSGSFLDYELGSPGSSAGAPGTGDTIDVVGNLTLDGTLNLAQSGAGADGAAGFGYYRILTYGGSLTDKGLAIGSTPPLADPALYRLDAGSGNVDLFIGAVGDDRLQHWQGGDGVWKAANEKWLNQGSDILVPWAGHHAVFKNAPGGFDGGTITVEGTQSFEGLQFVDSGYRLAGSGTLLIDGDDAEVRVLAGESAEIAAVIAGSGGLSKTEGGTLILQGSNIYQGGTSIRGGTVSVSADANLGDAAGGIALDGGALKNTAAFASGRAILIEAGGGKLQTDAALTLSGVISGPGMLTKTGAGTLMLTNSNSYNGGTTISAGVLNAAATGALGGGPVNVVGSTVLQISGDTSAENLDISLENMASLRFDDNASAGTAMIVSAWAMNFYGTSSAGHAKLTTSGRGLSFNTNSSAGDATITAHATVDFYGNSTAGNAVITGGPESAIRFHGANTADGATVRVDAGGRTDISDLTAGGIAIGSLSGGGAVYLGSKTLTLGGLGKDDVIGGVIQDGGAIGGGGGTGGSLVKTGTGTLTLNGVNSYTGLTTVQGGTLIVGGVGHSSAALAGDVAVGIDATLGGIGTIGGDVTVEGRLSSGNSPGTLTIGGDLSLAASTRLDFEFGEANVPGGALNDLVVVGGNLILDGTIDVTVPTGGAFGIGVYRVFNYGGTLTDNGLDFGTLPADSHVTLQTSIAGQVNLVNADIVRLSFWDGAVGPKNDGAINGGNGVWQASAGNDHWTDASGAVNAAYTDGAFAVFGGTAGTVTVDDALGAVSVAGMQFAADGYVIVGDGITLDTPQTVIRVGDGSTLGAGFKATINAALGGSVELVKTDAGTLILGGTNSYTGGTLINGGTVQIARDDNLGAAGDKVTLDGGTLATSADLLSDREMAIAGPGTIATAADTRFTFGGQFTGAGALTKAGAGTLLVTGNNDGFGGATNVTAGTLAVQGSLGGAVNVASGGRLEGGGRVGSLVNSGVVAPGSSIGTLTIAGDYEGRGGVLEIETELGGDSSVSDRLIVGGATSGSTTVRVTNRGGLGVPTVEGIKIVDVAGASNGSFALVGDYLFGGQQTLIAGAYGYRLVKNGVATPQDGDWYLRSAAEPGSGGPLYQPGVPVYEAYVGALQALNGLPTLQQRIGNRSWAGTSGADGTGIWGRFESQRLRPEAAFTTSGGDQRTDGWQAQMGADATLARRSDGATLVGGISAHYGTADTAVASLFGNGSIDTKGYGVGASLTWYGPWGFYVDGQAKLSWFESDLKSDVLGALIEGNDGKGRAFSVELGKRSQIGGNLTVTPQVQMTYTHVGFDRFADPFAAAVSADKGESLKTRWGVSLDHQQSHGATGEERQTHVYATVNLAYEWLDGARVLVSDTAIENRGQRLTGELGLGGSYSWGGRRFTLYTEVAGDTALADFGQGYSLKGTAGLRMRF